MSEEEKKAIERLGYVLEYLQDNYKKVDKHNIYKDVETIINLVKNQQKEIEELKAINNIQKYRIEVIDERELISKSKIEDIIDELKNGIKNNEYININQDCVVRIIINKLEELLESEE